MGCTKLIGVRKFIISDKGGRGLSQFLSFFLASGLGGASADFRFLADKGGGASGPPHFG